jgi:putative colanic acid biosynthesis acetyltransferase WcaF
MINSGEAQRTMAGTVDGVAPSPWSAGEKIRMILWELAWTFLCRWTPKPLNRWRLFWLRVFGAKLVGDPFVHSRARIAMPWNVFLGHRSCLGDGAHLYSLGKIEIGAGACIAQEAYVCTGTHDFASTGWPLLTKPIFVGEGAFVGARAFILPGLTIGEFSIVGAAAVVTKNVEPCTIVAGNPAKQIATRQPKTPPIPLP